MPDIHETVLGEEVLAMYTPLVRLHTRLRARGVDIAAAINPKDVDPVLNAMHHENIRMINWVEEELQKEEK